MDSIEKNEAVARDQAWSWFKYHADQRMTLMKFYITVVGFISVGYFVSLTSDYRWLAAIVALAGIAVSAGFWALDYRTATLIKLGGKVLLKEQEKICTVLGYPEIKIVKLSENDKLKFLGSYKKVLRFLFIFMILVSVGGMIVPFLDLDDSAPVDVETGAGVSVVPGAPIEAKPPEDRE